MTNLTSIIYKSLLVPLFWGLVVQLCIVSPVSAQRRASIRTGRDPSETVIKRGTYDRCEVCGGRALIGPLTAEKAKIVEKLFEEVKFPVVAIRISENDTYLLKSVSRKGTTTDLFTAFSKIIEYKGASLDLTLDMLEPDFLAYSSPRSFIGAVADGNWGRERIGAHKVWPSSEGDPNLVVAVLDSGINAKHSALKNNLWHAPVPYPVNFPGAPPTCPANSSYGVNLWWRTSMPSSELCQPTDNNSHGTMVAGIIGAEYNPLNNISGVARKIRILPIKISSSTGITCASLIIQGIDSVIAIKRAIHDSGQKLRIINASFVISPYCAVAPERLGRLEAAVKRAETEKILIVSAAGNKIPSKDIGLYPVFPASFSNSNIIAVAASTFATKAVDEKLLKSSNFGKSSVHLAAPGETINTTFPSNKYAQFDQTSAATPFVSGAAALLMSVCPDMTNDQIKSSLLAGANTISPSIKNNVMSGRLDVFESLKYARLHYNCPIR